jgi:uncharacterized metal-binding protein YceD (DUF177 family)
MSKPFSRAIRVEAIPKEGQTVTLEATASEREALAALYKLPSVEVLTASLTLERSLGGGIRVTGSVHGELTQVCVVSLEWFPATVDEAVDVRFAPQAEGDTRRNHEEPHTLSMDEDEPNPIVDGKIDLGALAAEFLALGLDPYPRRPGAAFEPSDDKGSGVTPFSILRKDE